MIEEYFPTGIASGSAFLGRREESLQLTNNITSGRHTLLLSPRRYGKTSLVKNVIRTMKLPFQEIDLFLTSDAVAIEQKILKGAKLLINELSETPDQWFKSLLQYFQKANKKWSIGIKGLNLQIEPENHSDIPDNILEALNAVESILFKKKQKAIIFLDEIQEIAQVKQSKAIEGAIRHFCQQSHYLTFVFSGSNRHMLRHMFEDRDRPLYALCERIDLGRLPAEAYQKYFNKVSQKTWQMPLNKNVFDRIIELTQCHPRIIYVFCGKLWDYKKEKSPLTVDDVNHVWDHYLKSKQKDIRSELKNLSAVQLKLLTLISIDQLSELTSKRAQAALGVSGSAITQALQLLDQKDYVEEVGPKKYQLIDPLIKAILVQFNQESLGM